MKADMTLYEKILDTPGFAFCFNELVKLAGAQQPADEMKVWECDRCKTYNNLRAIARVVCSALRQGDDMK